MGEGYAANVLEDDNRTAEDDNRTADDDNRTADEFRRLRAVAGRRCTRQPREEERGCICRAAEADHKRGPSEGSGREPGAAGRTGRNGRGGQQQSCRPSLRGTTFSGTARGRPLEETNPGAKE